MASKRSPSPSPSPAPVQAEQALREVLRDVLGLGEAQAAALGPHSGLFGHLPELDSMAVAGLLTEIEDRLGILIDDEDIDADMLETFGALLAFVEARRASR